MRTCICLCYDFFCFGMEILHAVGIQFIRTMCVCVCVCLSGKESYVHVAKVELHF